ncbi:MAG: hypothetical protein LBK61_07940 [Spirochaetaceae bacterium]|jgi:hypothetical protein|nr:hypothetical protein [Spirochaetaceae bacterium]
MRIKGSPCGSENPLGFHPCVNPIPSSGRNSSGMAVRAPPYDGLPCRGRKPAGFSSYREASPRSGRNSSGMAVRAPPYGGCASPSGAQCRRKGVL